MADESIYASYKAGVSYLEDGISVIPVRDKDETFNGKVKPKKSPYPYWKEYQTTRLDKERLFYEMDKAGTSAIATICGAVSGNLEAIDIDVKNHKTIHEHLFDQLQNAAPELWKRLRIVQTPSGGFHILYRINGKVPPNKKLAGRPATAEELVEKPNEKEKWFIESRGEGGYVVAPPSLGYLIFQDNPLPVLSMDERNFIINLCSLFSEIVKQEAPYNPNKSESSYYDVNPFEDYNIKEGYNALIECGWKFHSQSSIAILFTRPDSRSGGEHAAFLFDKKLYWFFTTNSPLYGRCYQPATVLAQFKYDGDKKALYKELVRRGFGRPKAEVKKKAIQHAIYSGIDLPENFTEQDQEDVKEGRKAFCAVPHFWKFNEKGQPEIDREDFYKTAAALGYRLHAGDLVRIIDNWIHRVDARDFYDNMKQTIRFDDDPFMLQEIQNTYEEFIQKNGTFSITRIEILNTEAVLMDTKTTSYKFYLDGYKEITADQINSHTYEKVNGLLWADRVQQRQMQTGSPGGKYVTFLEKAVSLKDSGGYVERIIGYLSHEYKDPSASYIIVLVEECEDPKQGGGSGKNVFSNLFKLTTTFTNKPGSQVAFNEKFFQSWNNERIFCISDLPKNFDFVFLKEPSSGDILLKKLYKDEVVIPAKDAPKFLLQTNYGVDIKDGGLARRIKQIEFTDFFTKCGGVDVHFGGMFPDDWTPEDWAGYDAFIHHCVQEWLKVGKIGSKNLTETGWMKQFDQMHGVTTREYIQSIFQRLVENIYTDKEQFQQWYIDFCNRAGIYKRKLPNQLNNAFKDWCDHHKYEFDPSRQKKIDGQNDRRVYISPLDAPF